MSIVRREIKSIIAKAGWTLTDIVDELNKRNSTNNTLQNLSNKLSKGTLRYKEALEIAEIIGYKLQWIKKD